jgi:flagellar motor switch protein FliN/FliY
MDLELPVSVRFGRTKVALSEALMLGDGAVLELDTRVDDPVEVVVNGRTVAVGQLIVVDGHYGVEISALMERPQTAPESADPIQEGDPE